MEPKQIAKMRIKTPVWVWIVRMGTGRWWPGRVESISLQDHLPLLKVRFEYQTFRNDKRYGPPVIGITTARMRHVELRDPDVKALDLPGCAPTPLMEKEERPDPSFFEMNGVGHRNLFFHSREGSSPSQETKDLSRVLRESSKHKS